MLWMGQNPVSAARLCHQCHGAACSFQIRRPALEQAGPFETHLSNAYNYTLKQPPFAGHESASGSDSDAAPERRRDSPSSQAAAAPSTEDAAAAAPGVEREDWMTKAMPRAKADAPELDQAAEAPEQPKKVLCHCSLA